MTSSLLIHAPPVGLDRIDPQVQPSSRANRTLHDKQRGTTWTNTVHIIPSGGLDQAKSSSASP